MRESGFFQNCGTFNTNQSKKYHNFKRKGIRAIVFLKWTDFRNLHMTINWVLKSSMYLERKLGRTINFIFQCLKGHFSAISTFGCFIPIWIDNCTANVVAINKQKIQHSWEFYYYSVYYSAYLNANPKTWKKYWIITRRFRQSNIF